MLKFKIIIDGLVKINNILWMLDFYYCNFNTNYGTNAKDLYFSDNLITYIEV